jgi:hypothetical protein
MWAGTFLSPDEEIERAAGNPATVEKEFIDSTEMEACGNSEPIADAYVRERNVREGSNKLLDSYFCTCPYLSI